MHRDCCALSPKISRTKLQFQIRGLHFFIATLCSDCVFMKSVVTKHYGFKCVKQCCLITNSCNQAHGYFPVWEIWTAVCCCPLCLPCSSNSKDHWVQIWKDFSPFSTLFESTFKIGGQRGAISVWLLENSLNLNRSFYGRTFHHPTLSHSFFLHMQDWQGWSVWTQRCGHQLCNIWGRASSERHWAILQHRDWWDANECGRSDIDMPFLTSICEKKTTQKWEGVRNALMEVSIKIKLPTKIAYNYFCFVVCCSWRAWLSKRPSVVLRRQWRLFITWWASLLQYALF